MLENPEIGHRLERFVSGQSDLTGQFVPFGTEAGSLTFTVVPRPGSVESVI